MEPAGTFHVVHEVEILDFDVLHEPVLEITLVGAVQYFVLPAHVDDACLVRAALAAVDAEYDGANGNLCCNDYAFACFLVTSNRLFGNLSKTNLFFFFEVRN